MVKPACVQLCDCQYEQVGRCQPTTWFAMHALVLGVMMSERVLYIYIYIYVGGVGETVKILPSHGSSANVLPMP